MNDSSRRIVVGISGASGVVYGLHTLKALKDLGYESHVVVTKAGREVMKTETGAAMDDIAAAATYVYDEDDLAAPISSGSFITSGMAVIPCSIKTLSAIAHSFNDNLLVRAADVTLKERRPLVLVVRETPLHLGHLQLMTAAASHGAVILPPVPAFYHNPRTIDDIIAHTVGKVLDCFRIPHQLYHRWGGG